LKREKMREKEDTGVNIIALRAQEKELRSRKAHEMSVGRVSCRAAT
jgi:hypothetical protein